MKTAIIILMALAVSATCTQAQDGSGDKVKGLLKALSDKKSPAKSPANELENEVPADQEYRKVLEEAYMAAERASKDLDLDAWFDDLKKSLDDVRQALHRERAKQAPKLAVKEKSDEQLEAKKTAEVKLIKGSETANRPSKKSTARTNSKPRNLDLEHAETPPTKCENADGKTPEATETPCLDPKSFDLREKLRDIHNRLRSLEKSVKDLSLRDALSRSLGDAL